MDMQELDDAAIRRFTRRFYIPLPDMEARLGIMNRSLQVIRGESGKREG